MSVYGEVADVIRRNVPIMAPASHIEMLYEEAGLVEKSSGAKPQVMAGAFVTG